MLLCTNSLPVLGSLPRRGSPTPTPARAPSPFSFCLFCALAYWQGKEHTRPPPQAALTLLLSIKPVAWGSKPYVSLHRKHNSKPVASQQKVSWHELNRKAAGVQQANAKLSIQEP